jgi:hypothetical protein
LRHYNLDEEDADFVHCSATDLGLEIILERAELSTGEGGGSGGGGNASFRVGTDS